MKAVSIMRAFLNARRDLDQTTELVALLIIAATKQHRGNLDEALTKASIVSTAIRLKLPEAVKENWPQVIPFKKY